MSGATHRTCTATMQRGMLASMSDLAAMEHAATPVSAIYPDPTPAICTDGHPSTPGNPLTQVRRGSHVLQSCNARYWERAKNVPIPSKAMSRAETAVARSPACSACVSSTDQTRSPPSCSSPVLPNCIATWRSATPSIRVQQRGFGLLAAGTSYVQSRAHLGQHRPCRHFHPRCHDHFSSRHASHFRMTQQRDVSEKVQLGHRIRHRIITTWARRARSPLISSV